MGIDPLTMFFIQAGVSLVSGIMEASAARQDYEAAGEQHAAEVAELTRQQQEEAQIAQQRRDARSIQADEDVASIVVAMEGGGGLNTLALVGEVGGMEGLDLAAINATARSKISSLQARKTQSGLIMQDTQRRASTRGASATLNFLGGVATAGGTYYGRTKALEDTRIPGPIAPSRLARRSNRRPGARGVR